MRVTAAPWRPPRPRTPPPHWQAGNRFAPLVATAPLRSKRQAAAQRSESPLPAPWTRHLSANHNRHYFHNAETGVSTWERPGFPAVQDQLPPPPPDPEPAPAPRPTEREEEGEDEEEEEEDDEEEGEVAAETRMS